MGLRNAADARVCCFERRVFHPLLPWTIKRRAWPPLSKSARQIFAFLKFF